MRLEMEGETWRSVGPVEALYDQRRGEFDGVWWRSRLSRMAQGFKARAFTLTFTLRCTDAEGGLAGKSARSRRYLQRPQDGSGKYCSSSITTPLQLER